MLKGLTAVHVVLVLSAAAVFITAGIISAQQPGQEETVRSTANQFIADINEEDVSGLMDTLSRDAVIDGLGFCPGDRCDGTDSIKAAFEAAANEDVRLQVVAGMERVLSPVWISEVELRAKAVTQAGSERLLFQLEIEVHGDNVTRLRFTPELDDEQTARFLGTESPASLGPGPVHPPSTGSGGLLGD